MGTADEKKPLMQEKETVSMHEDDEITSLSVVPPKRWMPRDADREAIRSRVRNASVGDNVTFIPAIKTPTIAELDGVRVAVYARVSTSSLEQVSSIENQTKYYTEKIAATPGWELASIYSDEGKTGTSMKHRPAFQQMLKDAKAGGIDMIMCASVSRFARNVSDCVTEVRRLKTGRPNHAVGVYFETENIYTLDPQSDQAFKMHAMLADWESANKSRRMILSYDQRICTGQYTVCDLLGYRHTKDGQLIMVEDEALTVRFIYLAFLAGYSCEEIAGVLTAKRRKTLTGRTDWNAGMVRSIMGNERRWGDLSARKSIVIDYVDRKIVRNNQQRDAAYVKGHHEGIVTPEIARAAKLLSSCKRSRVDVVPEISVVKSGCLTGFVSINPRWCGINDTVFLELSRSVYTDDEYDAICREARICTGVEHSNVYDMQFTGYEVPLGVYYMNAKSPALTISNGRIKLSAACHQKLDNCQYVEMLYHPILQMIALRECAAHHTNAVCWQTEGGNIITSFAAKAFTAAIYELQRWIRDYSFQFRGITKTRGGARIMIFYLDEPRIILSKQQQAEMAEKNGDQSRIQYIPYQKTDHGGTDDGTRLPCRRQLGISYGLRKRRDSVMSVITAEEMRMPGEPRINPLVGEIPNLRDIEEELDEILDKMDEVGA